LAPMLPGFLAEQTRVSIDLMLVDRPVRLAEEGIDVALRIGPLDDSDLIVRKLDDIQLVVCAAPDYLRRRGEPATPEDLVEQDCLTFGDVPGVAEWKFQDGAVQRSLRIPTRLCANDFDTLVSAALAGAGLVQAPSWQVAHCLADGRLRIVLEAYQRPPTPLSVLTLRNRLPHPQPSRFAGNQYRVAFCMAETPPKSNLQEMYLTIDFHEYSLVPIQGPELVMPPIKFSKVGLLYVPRSTMAWLLTLLTVFFAVRIFLLVDGQSHSVSDTLIGAVPIIGLQFWLLR
jgi:hypothetical protein